MKKFAVIIVIALFILCSLTGCSTSHINELNELIQNEKWDEAYEYYEKNNSSMNLGDGNYDKWKEMGGAIAVAKATPLYNEGDYDAAYEVFNSMGFVLKSYPLVGDILNTQAKQLYDNGKYDEAFSKLRKMNDIGFDMDMDFYNKVMDIVLKEYQTIDYSDAIRNPGSYADRKCAIDGYVNEVLNHQVIVQTEGGYKFDVDFSTATSNISKLLKGDLLTVYGEVVGRSSTYSSMSAVRADVIFCWNA